MATTDFLLQKTPLFEEVEPAYLTQLYQASRILRLEAMQTLFEFESAAHYFYLIESGEIHLFRPHWNGDERLFQILRSGDLLAESAMFLEPPCYPLTARAQQSSCLIAFPREVLLAVCHAQPQLMRRWLSIQSKRLYQAVNRIEHLSLNSAGQRLVSYLLELRRAHQRHWLDIPVNLDLPVNIAVLASQLAMTPETLSRLLQTFRRNQWISGRGRTLVLLDETALREHVGLPPASLQSGMPTPALLGCCNL